MSTTKKKTIKFTALMTVLILTVTYFSLLTPTSAYFYRQIDSGGIIKFSLFDVDITKGNEIFEKTEELKFKGATKFADYDEKLFDEVAVVKTYTVTNTGEVPATVATRVTPLKDSAKNGLKYMIIVSEPYYASSKPEPMSEEAGDTTEENSSTAETTTELPKGELKSEIESLLNLFKDSTTVKYSDAVSVLESYTDTSNHTRVLETGTTSSTDAGETKLPEGQSIDVKIIFWAEYDEVMNAVSTEDTSGEQIWQDAMNIASVDYSCRIEMIASQVKDEAVSDALTTTAVNQ